MEEDDFMAQALAEAGAVDDDEDAEYADETAADQPEAPAEPEMPEDESEEAETETDAEPAEADAPAQADESAADDDQPEPEAPAPKTALDDHDYNLLAEQTGLQPDGVQTWLSAVGQLSRSGVTPDQIGEAAKLAYLEQKDPKAALEILRGKMQKLGEAAGLLLPSDLQQKVDMGRMTQEEAQEFARERARQAQEKHDLQKELEDHKKEKQKLASNAITQWHTKLKARPDYTAALDRRILAEIQLLKSEGKVPNDPGQLSIWLDQLTDQMAPKPKAKKPTAQRPKSTGSGSKTQYTDPIDQALADAGAL